LNSWDEARRKGQFKIWAYVVMPEHVHLLVFPSGEEHEVGAILRSLKEGFSRSIVKHWCESSPQMLKRIRTQRGNRIVHSFWQEGGGFDRDIIRWDMIKQAVDYTEWNPVRRGLVRQPSDWFWSSASARSAGGQRILVPDQVAIPAS
ncbi:hypothetical protein GF377_07350, partial [candidate division GN15 bacterium]|nr:hypothetical protein [candidate division GN15 bacterium]